ncbi:MAG: hypothetical protein Fur0043_06350 [Anaerolineales bacterium]
MKRTGLFLLLVSFLALGACAPKNAGPSLNSQVAAAVAATVAAIPTCTPDPIPTPYPTPTPMPLDGLFCGYGFCIGHPATIFPFDLNAADKRVSSDYTGGKLVGYTSDLLLLVVWQTGASDSQYILELVAQAAGGGLTGSLDARLLGPYNVLYQPVQPPPDSTLPYGGAAAWECGKRGFGWLVYTAQDGIAPGLLDEALSRFTCGE